MAFNYIVSYGPSTTGPWSQYGSTTSTSISLTFLASGHTFYVQVVAQDQITSLSSAPVVSGPYTTLVVTTEAADGTFITTTSQSILASPTIGQSAAPGSALDTWTFDSTGQIFVNNVAAGTTSALLGVYYTGHTIYQKASNANALGVNPGWWSWNGSGWIDSQDPISTSSKIVVDTVLGQNTNIPFAVSGTIAGYASAPTLQYSDNQTGTWVNFPAGSSVANTAQGSDHYGTFTFIHPAVAVAALNQTVSVRDAAATTVTSTSSAFNITMPGTITLTGITLSNSTFTTGSPSGTTVGTISVQATGTFNGSLQLTGADNGSFKLSGNTLQTNGVLSTARTYNINIVATQPGDGTLTVAKQIIGAVAAAAGAVYNPGIAALPGVDTTSTYIRTDLVNNMTAAILNKAIFGIATNASSTFVNSGPYQFQLFKDPVFQTAISAIGFYSVRLNGWSTMHDEIFPNGNPNLGANDTSTPNWATVDNIVAGYRLCFPKSTSLLASFTGALKYDYTSTTIQDYVAAKSALIAQRFKDGGLHIDYWECVNEPNPVPPATTPTAAQIASLNAKCKATIHAVDSTIKVGGPVASWADTSFISASANNGGAEFIDWHQYNYVTGSNPTEDAIYASVMNGSFFNNAKSAQASTTAKNFVSCLTEYNIYMTTDWNDTRQQGYQGAIYTALAATTSAYGGLAIGSFWDTGSQDGLYGLFLGTTTNWSSNAAFFQAANSYMPQGSVCQVLFGGSGANSASLMGIVSVDSTSFGALLVNYSTTNDWAGPITLTSRASSANITKWMLNPANSLGTTSTITQASLSSIQLPRTSITILSGSR